MRSIEPTEIDEILFALNAQIEAISGESVSLVVIGGTALAAMGLINRTTQDMDILGEIIQTDGIQRIIEILEFPKWLIEAAEKVKRDFDLLDDWLNFKPSSYFRDGLPEGFQGRLVRKEYGSSLVIYFIDRIDQIHFKLYAAADVGQFEPRHLQDLLALNPTDEEMLKASLWAMEREALDQGFWNNLKQLLRDHGYESVAKSL